MKSLLYMRREILKWVGGSLAKSERKGGKQAIGVGDYFDPLLFKNKDEALIVGRCSPGRRVDCELVLKRALLAIPRVCRFIFSAFT